MILLKPEVRFHDPLQALPVILAVVASAFRDYDVVVTAAADGSHKVDSFHYRGLALDFRIKHVPVEHRPALVKRIKGAIPQCDVLWEGVGTEQEHLHVEWDPK